MPDMHTALPVLPESRPWRQNSGRVGLDADVRGKMVPEFAVRGPGLQAPWDSRQVDEGVKGLAAHKTLVLDIKTGRPYLVEFYRRHGFELVGTSRNHYGDGEDRFMMVRRA